MSAALHLDQPQIELLYRLGKSPDGRMLQELVFKPWLNALDAKLRTAAGNELLQLQGQAQLIERLLLLLNEDPKKKQIAMRPRPLAGLGM